MKNEQNKAKKNSLGENIKKLRKQHNMSQEELAQKLFISRTAISKWESGATEANIEFLMKLSELFNVDLDELISKKKEEPKVETKEVTHITKRISTPKELSFAKSYSSLIPKNKRDSKTFGTILTGYILGTIFFLAGFYLTVIVLAIWGNESDPTNKYTLQVFAGIPLMILGIIALVYSMKRHLYFGLIKRSTLINSSVNIKGNSIFITSGSNKVTLNKKNLLSVNVHYEHLPTKLWKNKRISPAIVTLSFKGSELSLFEITDYKDIKEWVEGV